MTTAIIIVAGGQGRRAGGEKPKQYQRVGGKTVMAQALEHAASCPAIDIIQPVIGADHQSLFSEAIDGLPSTVTAKLRSPVTGGATRQASTWAGLNALDDHVKTVLVHDAARAFLPSQVVDRLLAAINPGVGAIPTLAVPDSVKRLSGELVHEDVDRSNLVRAQTPQAFVLRDLMAAFAAAPHDGFTDEAGLAKAAGIKIVSVCGDEVLFKITHPEDFKKADAMASQHLSDVRTGSGFDVHAFEPGDHVIVCGVTVPHTKKLKGHSDADVGLHALTDAILGAIGAGDIGDHFPPSDPQWKGAPSDLFLRHASGLVAAKGGVISNLDITLICERPKIGPHRRAMVETVADLLGLEHERVSIKATTTEKLGFTGREEGIAAQAVVTVRLP